MANELGINMGEVYGAVDAVQTARLRNKIAEQEMALRQEDQGIRRNAIAEEQRRYDTGQAKDAAATTARGNMIRGAMDGSGGGFDAYVMIEPEQALKLKTYFDGLDEAKRTKALAEAKEQNATMGRIAAWVEGSADPAAAYAQARENLPPEVQAQMPPGYDKNRMQGFLAQAMEMDDLLTRLDKKGADAALSGVIGGGAAPGGAPAEREPANAGRFANGPSAARGAPAFFSQLEQQYRLPAGYLDRTWGVESGRGTNMDNPNSSAAGHFQFIDSTAAQYGVNRGDLGSEAEGAARLASDNANVLRQALGREPTAGELYLAHQQGAGGAAALLSNPDAPASSVVGEKAVRLNGGTPGMTAGEFAAKWTGKIDGDGGAPAAVGTPFSPQEQTAMRAYAMPGQSEAGREMIKLVLDRLSPAPQSPEGKVAADQKAGILDPNAPKPYDFTGEQDFRKEFTALPPVKSFQVQADAFGKVAAAAKDPSAAGDLAMIFSFMKILDPNSVVREQEFANAQNAAGVPEQIRNAWNRALNGERLNPEQRNDFLRVAQATYDQSAAQVRSITDQYTEMAKARGLDPARALPDFGFSGEMPQLGAAGGDGTPQVRTVEEYNALPSGTTYVDPNGKTKVKR